MTESALAPARYLSGTGSLAGVGAAAAKLGTRVLLVHGDVGLGLVEPGLSENLRLAGLSVERFRVTGPCSAPVVAAVRNVAGAAEVLVGVGGGRVLDVAKAAAADLGAACVLVPTSPATCAAATAVVVDYTPEGAYLGSRLVSPGPAYTVVEPSLLAAAPDRLLVAGLVDALAKVVEVRFGLGRLPDAGAAGIAALALCDELERLVFADGPFAVATSDRGGAMRLLAAECSVLWPGLVGALAGEGAKLAAAHAVHNALTLLPGLKRSLHGEVLAFGILTQLVLEGWGVAMLERYADLFGRLGCPMTLNALGAGAYWQSAEARRLVLERTCALPSLAAAFPEVGPAQLEAAFARADEVAAAFSR